MTGKGIVLAFFVGFVFWLNAGAQDFEIYPILPDSKIKMPILQENMGFDEFDLLQTNLRMKDMLYAMAVPGFIHFKAKENRTGYSLLGLRTAGFLSIAYMGVDAGIQFRNIWNWDFQKLRNKIETRAYLYSTLSVFAISSIFGTYFYDWIHGEYILLRKQNQIRYKYGMKLKLQELQSYNTLNQPSAIPSLSVTLTF